MAARVSGRERKKPAKYRESDLPLPSPSPAKKPVKKKTTETKVAEEKKLSLSQVAILFLAHNGIRQPAVWQRWREESAFKDHVHFYVYNEVPGSLNEYFQEYKLRSPPVPTGWCLPGLVYAYQVGLREVLKRQPNVDVVYLVSGADIPVRSASFLVQVPPRTRICRVPPQDEKKSWIANVLPPTALRRLQKEVKTINLETHLAKATQWVALNHEHARVIADFNFGLFDAVQLAMEEHKKETEGEAFECPDEWWVLSALLVSGVKWADMEDHCITDTEWAEGARSPITWSSWNQRATVARGAKTKRVTFAEVLEKSQTNTTTFFMRKVDESLDFVGRDLMPWHAFMTQFIS